MRADLAAFVRRREALRIAMLLWASLALTGCSWITDFIVLNATDAPVTVRYRLKAPLSSLGHRLDWPPLLVRADRLRESGPWKAVPAVQRRERDTVIVLVLPPNHAVRLLQRSGYTRPDLDAWRDFPLEELAIAAGRAEVRHCGPAILLAFEGSRHEQLLTFHGTPHQIAASTC